MELKINIKVDLSELYTDGSCQSIGQTIQDEISNKILRKIIEHPEIEKYINDKAIDFVKKLITKDIIELKKQLGE